MIALINFVSIIWLAVCFYFDWEPWLQVFILIPNMIAWTVVSSWW